jgi:hypothetical protein
MKSRPGAAGQVGCFQPAAVRLHDRSADGEADAHAAFLGGKEALEQAMKLVFGYPGTIVLNYDLSLAQYGPEAAPLRSALRNTLAGIDNVIWGDGRSDPQQFRAAAVLPSLRGMVARFSALNPINDGQKQLLGTIGVDEADKTPHVAAAREPHLLAAPHSGRVMVDLAVLRVRNSLETEHYDSRRPGPWIFRRRQRDISYPRIE